MTRIKTLKSNWLFTRIVSVASTIVYSIFLFTSKKVNRNINVSADNLRSSTPVVIISNHQRLSDFLALFAALGPRKLWAVSPVKFMTWHRIYYSWAWLFLYSTGCFPTHRARHSGVEGAIYYAKNGFRVFICPEGKRVKDGKRHAAYDGIVRILEKLDNPDIILSYIHWHPRTSLFERPRVDIVWSVAPTHMELTNPDKIMDEVYNLAGKL